MVSYGSVIDYVNELLDELRGSDGISMQERLSHLHMLSEIAKNFADAEASLTWSFDVDVEEFKDDINDATDDFVSDEFETGEDVASDEVMSEETYDTDDFVGDDFDAVDDAEPEMSEDAVADDDYEESADEVFDESDDGLAPLLQNAYQDTGVFRPARDIIEYGTAGEFVDDRDA